MASSESPGVTIQPAWNDLSLEVPSDTAWRAQYRRLQSWYRETVLRTPPGADRGGTTRANMLPADAVAENPGLNFLDEGIAAYALERARRVIAEAGTLDPDRLRRNMLSSMPLCFNLFGALRRYPTAAARGLGSVLDLDIEEILEIEVEWAPDPNAHLGDLTAFDAFVRYRTGGGRRAFLGVETKYTEPFSPGRYTSERYDALTRDPASGFRPGAERRLAGSATNQLWRNALLAHSLRSTDEFDEGRVVVLSCRGDAGAERAIAGLSAELRDPPALLRSATYEELVAAFDSEPQLSSWAADFRGRYLDLTPVNG